jgi:hypothetical protein
MEKRGTGWIPDYPDIRDYRLENEAIQNLTNKIQSQGDITSIETLARKVYEALDILAANCKNNSEDKGGRLTTLRDGLEKEIIGDFRFVTAKLHNVLQLGMADSEVLLIKNYLQRIISTWRQFKDFPYEPEITNTTFDSKTSETVIKILEDQTSLQSDGLVSKDDVVAVGYDDRKVIENADGEPTEGALLIRNSWGTRWGQGGYGWLPYDYITKGLTADWWSLLKAEWLATGRFGAGASAWNADKGTNEVENVPPPPPP